MIGAFRRYGRFEQAERGGHAARRPGVEDEIRRDGVEHGLHGQRRVDLAHAGRSKHHPHAADPTDVQREHGARKALLLRQVGQEGRKLLLRRTEDRTAARVVLHVLHLPFSVFSILSYFSMKNKS